jgi:hypothetical protein
MTSVGMNEGLTAAESTVRHVWLGGKGQGVKIREVRVNVVFMTSVGMDEGLTVVASTVRHVSLIKK